MSPRLSLKQIANIPRSSSGVRDFPIRFCPDSVALDRQTTSDDEETVVEAPTDEEASYSCTETFVGSSNESVIGNDESISDYSEWTNSGSGSGSGSEWSFSDVDESRTWCDHVELEM